MDGRIGGSLHVAQSFVNSAQRLKLTNNEILTVRVAGRRAATRYSVVIRGTTLEIESTRLLAAGDKLWVKVLIRGRRIELRVLPVPSSSPDPAGRQRSLLPAVPVAGVAPALSNLVVQSLARSGMPLLPATVAAIAGMLPGHRKSDPEFIRFATIAYDKGLRMSPQQLEELFLTVTGRNPRGDERGGQEADHGRQGHSREQGAPGTHRPGGVERTDGAMAEDSPTPSVRTPLVERLKAQLRDQVSGRPSDTGESTVLFNHRTGAHETWVIVPFRVSDRGTSVEGSLRILLRLSPGQSAGDLSSIPLARVVVDAKEYGCYEVFGSPPGRVVPREALSSGQVPIRELLPELAEKLRNLGVEIDDTNNGGAVFDGFGAEDVEIRGIDATV